MAHISIQHLAAPHPRTARLRKRVARQLLAVRPSRRNELWYRAKLGALVNELRAAVTKALDGQHWAWSVGVGDGSSSLHEPLNVVVVADVVVPTSITEALRRAALRFGDIGARARAMAELLVRRNLGAVDERLAAALLRSVGVDIRSALSLHTPGPASVPSIGEAMATAARANVALITSIPEQYFDDVAAVVTESWAAGLRWETLIAKIKERGDVADSRARLIARDQTSKMNASFNEVRQVGAGINRYTWSTSQDERVRRTHRDLEGQIFRWDSPPMVDGEPAHPGQPINCRCAALPLLDIDFEGQGEGVVALEEEREAA